MLRKQRLVRCGDTRSPIFDLGSLKPPPGESAPGIGKFREFADAGKRSGIETIDVERVENAAQGPVRMKPVNQFNAIAGFNLSLAASTTPADHIASSHSGQRDNDGLPFQDRHGVSYRCTHRLPVQQRLPEPDPLPAFSQYR